MGTETTPDSAQCMLASAQMFVSVEPNTRFLNLWPLTEQESQLLQTHAHPALNRPSGWVDGFNSHRARENEKSELVSE